MKPCRRAVVACICLAAVASAVPASAQEWPVKSIRLVVTFAPGGSSDVVARALSVPLQKALGQPVPAN